jgi:hypothetical protein
MVVIFEVELWVGVWKRIGLIDFEPNHYILDILFFFVQNFWFG